MGTRHFVERTEGHWVTALRTFIAQSLERLVPSMGIPADLVIVYDGVSIGARMFSQNESMMLIGVVVLQPTEDGSWSEAAHLLAAPSAGQMHTGPEQAELILQSLADHPAQLTTSKLRARLGLVGSDGAACAGGEHALHLSTKASEKIWASVHPQAAPLGNATEWDLLHRLDRAAAHAIGHTPAAVGIFDVARALGALFGVGDGRVIFRATAEAIGEQRFRVPDQGGSREIVALGRTVEHLLKSQRTFHASLHARLCQSKTREGT